VSHLKSYTDDELIELWEERAAIMEFDGGLERRQANYLACKELMREIAVKRIPKTIIEQSKRNFAEN
jgi:hypothetical protein